MSKDNSERHRIREESAVQVIQVAGAIAVMLAGVMIQAAQRKADGPDAGRAARMRAARAAERAWARAAALAWRQAERARLAYERERPP